MGRAARTLCAVGIFAIAMTGASLAPAATDESEFGPPPEKACAPDGGCYGSDVGPNFMDNARNGELVISPHVVKVGETLTMTITMGNNGGWERNPPGLEATGPCTADDTTCVFTAVAPTSGWERYNQTFEFGSREQDYYGVLVGPATIHGRVVDEKGNGVPGVQLKTQGRASHRAETDLGGFYEMRFVNPGRYTVKPASKDVRTFKPRSREVTVGAGTSARANFEAETGCRKDAGPPAVPQSGHYAFGPREFGSAYSLFADLWFACRTGEVSATVSFLTTCDGQFEERRNTYEMRGVARPQGGKYHFEARSENGFDPLFATATGEFQGRNSVEFQFLSGDFLAGFPDKQPCRFAYRMHLPWLSKGLDPDAADALGG